MPRALSQRPPPGAAPGRLAYKTGTSYGYRDAWSIGFDGRMIGRMVARDALFDFRRIGIPVAGNDAAVRKPHHERRIVRAPIEIDQQAGITAQKGRRAESPRKGTRHRSGPDVIGDMGLKQIGAHPQTAIFGR